MKNYGPTNVANESSVAVPFALISGMTGQGGRGVLFAIAVPVGYAIAGLLFVPLCCLIFNLVAKLVGGLEFDVTDAEAT